MGDIETIFVLPALDIHEESTAFDLVIENANRRLRVTVQLNHRDTNDHLLLDFRSSSTNLLRNRGGVVSPTEYRRSILSSQPTQRLGFVFQGDGLQASANNVTIHTTTPFLIHALSRVSVRVYDQTTGVTLVSRNKPVPAAVPAAAASLKAICSSAITAVSPLAP